MNVLVGGEGNYQIDKVHFRNIQQINSDRSKLFYFLGKGISIGLLELYKCQYSFLYYHLYRALYDTQPLCWILQKQKPCLELTDQWKTPDSNQITTQNICPQNPPDSNSS